MRAASPTRRAQQKAATRTALLNAATQCFIQKGVENTQISDIGKTGGFAHGTFYTHFPDKSAIARLLLDQLNANLAREMSEVPASGDPRVVVRAFASLFLGFLARNPLYQKLFVHRMIADSSPAEFVSGLNPALLRALSNALHARVGGSREEASSVVAGLAALWVRLGFEGAGRRPLETANLIETLTIGALEAHYPNLKGDLP